MVRRTSAYPWGQLCQHVQEIVGNACSKSLQDRFDQDNDLSTHSTWDQWNDDYLDNTIIDNGRQQYRRQIRVAFNDGNIPNGSSGDYSVSGFGCFFMASRPMQVLPSSAICLMFVGACSENGQPNANSDYSEHYSFGLVQVRD